MPFREVRATPNAASTYARSMQEPKVVFLALEGVVDVVLYLVILALGIVSLVLAADLVRTRGGSPRRFVSLGALILIVLIAGAGLIRAVAHITISWTHDQLDDGRTAGAGWQDHPVTPGCARIGA